MFADIASSKVYRSFSLRATGKRPGGRQEDINGGSKGLHDPAEERLKMEISGRYAFQLGPVRVK